MDLIYIQQNISCHLKSRSSTIFSGPKVFGELVSIVRYYFLYFIVLIKKFFDRNNSPENYFAPSMDASLNFEN